MLHPIPRASREAGPKKRQGAHRVEAEHAVGLALDGVVRGALVHRVLRGWKQIKGVSRKHLTGGWLEAIQRGWLEALHRGWLGALRQQGWKRFNGVRGAPLSTRGDHSSLILTSMASREGHLSRSSAPLETAGSLRQVPVPMACHTFVAGSGGTVRRQAGAARRKGGALGWRAGAPAKPAAKYGSRPTFCRKGRYLGSLMNSPMSRACKGKSRGTEKGASARVPQVESMSVRPGARRRSGGAGTGRGATHSSACW